MTIRFCLLFAPLLVTGCGAAPPEVNVVPDASGKPNVVVILLDTLRADYLGAYGHEPETAPFLNRIAGESALFTRAFSSSSWTAPATASLFTSTYPIEHGIIMGLGGTELLNARLEQDGEASIQINHIRSESVTLPEHFRAIGYRTFGVASNKNVGEPMGFVEGFDEFSAMYAQSAEAVYGQVLAWKRALQRPEPYFLYLHLNDVHEPYVEREPYFGNLSEEATGARRQYLSEIGYLDGYVKRIYDTLNLAENTVLVILSDHGEEFGDHGRTGHGARLYRELNHIVMMVHAPGLNIPAQRIGVNVSIIDVLPTLLEMCGLPEADGVTGNSLAGLLWGGDKAEVLADSLNERTVFAHRVEMGSREHAHWSATLQHWKLYEPWEGAPELYDHRVDFSEQHNVFNKEEEVARMLTEQLAAFKGSARDHSATSVDLPVDRELYEMLETLGYIE